MKTIIYVFSGTGNTLKVAGLYRKNLGEEDTEIYRVFGKNERVPDPNGYDAVGFAYPIHAFNAPKPMLDFCKNLPKVDPGKYSFILKTSGEGLHLNDCSSQKVIGTLKKKGFDIALERHIVMPYNMIFRHTDGMAKQMWIYAHALAELNCREIAARKKEKVRQPLYKTWYAPLFRIEQPFARLHGKLFKADKEKCVGCGLCVKNCPMENIRIEDGKAKFGGNCALCMACSFFCPTDAVSVGVFRGWKVHGAYPLDALEKDPAVPFPYLDGSEKGVYKVYRKYYRECDERLAAAGIKIADYVCFGERETAEEEEEGLPLLPGM